MVRYEPIDILTMSNSYTVLKERHPTPNLLIVVEPSNFNLLPRNSADKGKWTAQFTIYELDSSDVNFESKAHALLDHSPNEWLVICSPVNEKAIALCARFNIDITRAHYSYFGI